MMKTLFCRKGGLMEDPEFHWESIGEGEGNTTREVADDLAKRDKAFARDYDPTGPSYWGWKLSINPNEVGIDV
jgi:hypothetical protein